MKEVEKLFESIAPKLEALAKSNAVVGRVVSVDGRHAIPLVELSLSLGGGGGTSEGEDPRSSVQARGQGGGAGGGVKAVPVAVLVIEGNRVRITPLGH
jgi:uncharacterized spore protein YtfJ